MVPRPYGCLNTHFDYKICLVPKQQDLCEIVIHCNKHEKGHIFLCLFFFLLTITGRNEAIIVELKELFVLNDTFITCSGCSHH